MPSNCPVCGDALKVARLECDQCHTAIEGSFESGRLGRLTRDEVSFVEVFLECRGKIKDVEQRLGLSYPTVVARLERVVEALGAPKPAPERETTDASTEGGTSRGRTLDDVLAALAKHEISPAEAAQRIKQNKRAP